MARNDVDFIFDPEQFINAINKINDAVANMSAMSEKQMSKLNDSINQGITQQQENVKEITTSVSKSGSKTIQMFSAVGNVLTGIKSGIDLLKRGFSFLNRFVPELGRTLEVVTNIFMRNFLWPLRKLLIPVLQSVLNWVRENRIMFVKWGALIANVFKAIMQIGKNLFGLVKTFGKSFIETFQKTFGTAVSGIDRLINMLIFRITTVAIFLSIKLKPVLDFFGKLMGVIAKLGVEYFKGFVSGMKPVLKILGEFITEFLGAIGTLTKFISKNEKLKGSLDKVGKAFMKFGDIVASAFKIMNAPLLIFFKLLTEVFNLVQGKENVFTELSKGNIKFAKNFAKQLFSDIVLPEFAKTKAKPKKVKDALITKDGKVIEGSANDNVLFFKKLPATRQQSINLSFNPTIKVENTINEGTPEIIEMTKKVGQMTFDVMADKVKNLLKDQSLTRGFAQGIA